MSVRTGRRPIAPANCARRWHALSEMLRSIHAKFTGRPSAACFVSKI
jgi:hypothetical protein